MIEPFRYNAPLQRVVLRAGAAADARREAEELGARRVMLVCGGKTARTELLATVAKSLGELCVRVFDRVVEHSSTRVVEEGAAIAREFGIDALIAVGGGSASDTAKAIAIVVAEGGAIADHASRFEPPDRFMPKPLPHPKLPIIAVPTTASAAEVTAGLGVREPETGVKLLFSDLKLAARVILLDPQGNLEVPVSLMATTGMNALAHCVEGLYSRTRNPISEALALQGARLLCQALPAMAADPGNIDHRAAMLVGANLSGMVLVNARVGIHHAICHCLGGLGGLPHGVANSIMLPHAMTFNREAAAPELAKLATALGAPVRNDPAQAAIDAILRLRESIDVPRRLRDTRLDRALLPAIAEHVMGDRSLYFNPRRPQAADEVEAILEQAW